MPRLHPGPHHLSRGVLVASVLTLACASPASAQLPDINLPDVQVPEVQIPDVQVPNLPAPGGGGGGGGSTPSGPTITTPDVKLPPIKTPDVKVPTKPGDVKDTVGGVVDNVKGTVGGVTDTVRETVRETGRSVGGTVRETTKPVTGGGTAGGGTSGGSATGGGGGDDDDRRRRPSSDGGSSGGGGGGSSAADGGPSVRAGAERDPGSLLGSVLGFAARRGDDPSGSARGGARRELRLTAGERAAREAAGGRAAGTAAAVAGAVGADGLPLVNLQNAADTGAAADEGEGGSGILSAVGDAIDTILRPLPDWSRPIIGVLLLLLLAMGARNWLRGRHVRRLTGERQVLTGDLAVLQQALVPPVPAEIGGLWVSVAYRPAAGLAAGGDFYDAFPLDEHRVGLVLGDVSGHDRTSIPRAASVRHKLRAYLELGLEPRAVMRVAGEALADDSMDGDFTTAVVAVHDRRTGELTYATAGHMPPILTGSAAHAPLIAGGSPPLGWGVPTGQRQTTVVLSRGSTACLFTDGLIEARQGDEQLGRERIEEFVAKLPGGAVAATALLEEVILVADRADDDLAALVVHASEDVDTPVRRMEELEVEDGEAGVRRATNVLQAWGLHDEAVELAVSELEACAAEGPRILKIEYDAGGEPVELNVVPRATTPALA